MYIFFVSEEELIKTKHWVDKLITKIAPKKDTKREQRVKSLTIFSTGVANIKPLYLKRIMCGVTVLIFSIILVITDTQITKISILNNIYSGLNKEIMDTVISVHDDSNEYVKQSISNDKYVINVIKRAFKKEYENAEDKQIFVEDIIKSDNLNYGQYNEIAAQRINSKISLLSKIDIKIIIVAVIVLFLIGYNLPYLDLIISKLLSKSTIAYDELLGCYTTVLILITYKASNVKMLIEWLSSFTVLYRFKFQRVLDYLNKESVMELNQEIRYKPLNNLLECIVLAINGLSMKDAFAGIEQQYIFQEERRSITNEKTIKFRQGIIQLLSWLSMGYMFGIYVMFPLIMSVVDMMKILE